MRTAGWMPARELAQLGERVGRAPARRELFSGLRGLPSSARLGEPQHQRQRDEPLLRAVVEVALEPPALVVAGRDDPGARRRELLARVGVGERRARPARRSRRSAARRPAGTAPGVGGRDDHRAPQAPGDGDRRADRGADAGRAQPPGELALELVVVVDPRGTGRCGAARGATVSPSIGRSACRSGRRARRRGPGAEDRGAAGRRRSGPGSWSRRRARARPPRRRRRRCARAPRRAPATSVATRRSAACSRSERLEPRARCAVPVIATAGSVRTARTRRWASARRSRPSCSKMFVTCFSTARSVTTSCVGDRACSSGPPPSAPSTSRSRVGQLARADRRRRRRPSSCETTSGSSAEPPSPTRRTASRKSSDVGDAVLEQVADALGAVGQQVERVALLDVLREHEHAGLRMLAADLFRGDAGPSSVLVGGMRMSTIATSGVCAATLRSRSSASPAWPTTSNPALLEQPGDALAQEHRVLGDHDAHAVDRGLLPRAPVHASTASIASRESSSLATNPRAPLSEMRVELAAVPARCEHDGRSAGQRQ